METNKMANEGDKVLFKRNSVSIIGEVIQVKEGSVVVQINDSDAERIKIDTPITVVSHKNYKIVN